LLLVIDDARCKRLLKPKTNISALERNSICLSPYKKALRRLLSF
jgi:hypothetical protein